MLVHDTRDLTQLRTRLRTALAAAEPVGFDVETTGPYITLPNGKRVPDPMRHRIVGYAYAFVDGAAWYVNLVGAGSRLGDAARPLRYVDQPTARVVAHNWAYEYRVLQHDQGLSVGCRLFDSMLAAWARGYRLPKPHGLKLKPLMAHYFNRRRPDFDTVMRGRPVDEVPADEVAPYCSADAADALALWVRCRGEMADEEWANYEAVEEPTIRVACHMMDVGVPLDAALLRSMADAARTRMGLLRDQFSALTRTTVPWPTKVKLPKVCPDHTPALCRTAGCVDGTLYYKNGKVRTETVLVDLPTVRGCDIGSSTQLGLWMFGVLGWWPSHGHPTTASGLPSTKADHLRPLVALPGNPGHAAALRCEYQALVKYADLYTTGMLDTAAQYADGRLHTSYAQAGTNTGRFSSSQPNISNIPTAVKASQYGIPPVRAGFVAPPGWKVVIRDISQAELRVLAHLSQDPVLLRVYADGGDVHGELMAELGITDRVLAKTTNFSCIYRIGPRSLAVKLTVATGRRFTSAQAGAFIDAFHARFARVRDYHARAIAVAERRGYARSLGGFRMPLPPEEWAARRHYTENRAINYPIQGTVGTILKRALVALHARWRDAGVLGSRVYIQGQTYDEIIVLARDDFSEQASADMRDVMESDVVRAPLSVRLVTGGGAGSSWQEAK